MKSGFSKTRVALLPHCSWLRDECLTNWIAHNIQPLGHSICDIGAGDGCMLPTFEGLFSRIIAIEPSPSAILALKRRSIPRSVIVTEGRAESLPLPSKSVDIAFAKSSFHHFELMQRGLREMSRIARTAVVIVEVISPSEAALAFARELLSQKEPERPLDAVFSESSLTTYVEKVAHDVRCLHFDQYIDIARWLHSGGLRKSVQAKIHDFVDSQSSRVKEDMHIHLRKGRLMMLRRMGLVIGVPRSSR